MQVLRREVTGMDARQTLRPRMGRSARSSREQGRSEGTRSEAEGRMNGAMYGSPTWVTQKFTHIGDNTLSVT